MKKHFALLLGFLVIAATLLTLWQSPLPVLEVLTHPFVSLWGTQEQWVVDVITHLDPVEAATRHLIQPLGNVRITQRYAVPTLSSQTKSNN
jgi:hypothetical protein